MSACTNATCVRLAAEAAEDAAAEQAAVVAAIAVLVGTFLLLFFAVRVHLRRVDKRQQAQAHRANQQSAAVASDDNAADGEAHECAGSL